SLGDDHDLRDLKKLLKETDYDLVPLYFNGRVLSTERPVAAKTTSVATPVVNRTTPQAPTETPVAKPQQRKPQSGSNTAPVPTPTKKKKHKNRHSKNKGMRKKWRDR